jgi:uncharacterized sulfatase
MPRPNFLAFVFLPFACAVAAPSAAPDPAAAATPARPNVILIISDDHGFNDYGFMGNQQVRTPRIDRIASEGVLYTRGYVTPVCSPSLASLLTGQYPSGHGITGNDLYNPSLPRAQARKVRDPISRRLFANSLLLPRALAEAGYLTMQTGKLWNMGYRDAGFTHGMTTIADRHGGEGLAIGREGMQPIFDFIALAQAEKKPFFVWYAPYLPHTPHNPPARLRSKYRGKGPNEAAELYHAMVEWLDETCGELDDYLTQNNLADNTVVLYLADNGWDGPATEYQNRAKLSPYETGVRSPMFVRWPAKVKPLRDDDTLASIVDFAPTILKAAGVPVPADLPGVDLLDRAAMTARESVFVEAYTHDIMDIADPSKSLTAHVIINGPYKLLVPGNARPDRMPASAPTEIELFDLKADPLESRNLAAEKPEVVSRLRALLPPIPAK